jgi:hypothetical protein
MMSKYTKSARGQECQVRIPGVCNHNPETVVLAHLNGAGMGKKALDIHGAYACFDCHAYLDGGWTKDKYLLQTEDSPMAAVKLLHIEAVIRTQEIMVKEGILVL